MKTCKNVADYRRIDFSSSRFKERRKHRDFKRKAYLKLHKTINVDVCIWKFPAPHIEEHKDE